MVKTSNVALFVLLAFFVGFVLGAVTWRKYKPCVELPVVTIQRDTVTVHDTILGQIPTPRKVEVIRTDTVRLEISPNTVPVTPGDTNNPVRVKEDSAGVRIGQNGGVLIPISRKIYETQEYRAVVSGWRPSLDSIQLYRRTTTIRETVTKYKSPRWAITAGPGVGFDGRKVTPVLGVSFGLVIWTR